MVVPSRVRLWVPETRFGLLTCGLARYGYPMLISVYSRPASSALDDATHDSMINPYLTHIVMRCFLAGLLADWRSGQGARAPWSSMS